MHSSPRLITIRVEEYTVATMEIEITIKADESELSEVTEMLSGLDAETEVAAGDEGESPIDELTEEELYVIAAVQESPRSALRVIQRTANQLEGSPFTEYDEDEGWNEERERIQSLLWSLSEDGWVENDGQQWYPGERAPDSIRL